VALESQIVGNLVNRLQVVDWIGSHPEVVNERIERPLFVLGLPRTGTTLLSYLLDADPARRSLMRWEAMSAVPPPEAATFATDPRIDAARESQAMLDAINPAFKAIHYEAPDGPTECVAILSQEFKSLLWETEANVPSYGAWLLECDYASAYAYHRRELQLLQSRAPGRWALKSPGHCFGLDALIAEYPDARFVMTHRDPVVVCASVCSLVRCLSGTFTDADHGDYINRHWPDVMAEAVRRVMEFRAARHHDAEGAFFDLAYEDLVADPVGSVRKAYAHFGDELSPAAEAAMQDYAAANPKGTHGSHRYDLDGLGLDGGALRERFSEYEQHYGVHRELG
jgi:sulfotransferase family protein